MDKPPALGPFKSMGSMSSLPELGSLSMPTIGSIMPPPQPKRAWVRRVTNRRTVSPKHQDLVPLDNLPAPPQPHRQPQPFNLAAAKLRKNVPALGGAQALPKHRAPPVRQLVKDETGELTSRDNKQWEFRMPGVAPAPAAGADVDAIAASDRVNAFKAGFLLQNNRLPKQQLALAKYPVRASPEPSNIILEHKQSHGTTFSSKPNQASKTMGLHNKPLASLRQFRSHVLAPAVSPTSNPTDVHLHFPSSQRVDQSGLLHVEGSAVSGGVGIDDEAVQAMQALGALEVSVGKERRLKDEMARNHKLVLKSFRGVVSAFFAGVHSTSGPRKSLALAKCSVVVHTLVSTIQTYLRWRQAHHVLALLQQGMSLLASRIAMTAQLPSALDPSMLGAPYTPSPIAECASTPFSTDSNSTMHDNVLDLTTINRLKQLYFDYYDCECFILPGMRGSDDDDDDVQVLNMGDRSVHSVIEERNVLLPPPTPCYTELALEEEAAGSSRSVSAGASPVLGSMVFDETIERERIFGADESSEEDCIFEEM